MRLCWTNSMMPKLLMQYECVFDPQDVVRRHAVASPTSQSARLTNFLGVTVDPTYFGSILEGRSGDVEGLPIPGNWHACVAEWGACLRSLDLARDRFAVIELGCGWACWLNNMGVAAKRVGLEYELAGVEGDSGHIAFASKTLAENGISADRVTLHRGVAASMAGVALFPANKQSGDSWGMKPIFGATEAQLHAAISSGAYEQLPMVPLDIVIGSRERIDLLHIDIQGGEGDLVETCRSLIRGKIAYMMIGTHSREIERRVRRILSADGWLLEVERPAIYKVKIPRPRLKVDGVQGWRNPRFLPL